MGGQFSSINIMYVSMFAVVVRLCNRKKINTPLLHKICTKYLIFFLRFGINPVRFDGDIFRQMCAWCLAAVGGLVK